MKHLVAIALALSSIATALAKCPDLSGNYPQCFDYASTSTYVTEDNFSVSQDQKVSRTFWSLLVGRSSLLVFFFSRGKDLPQYNLYTPR